MNIILKIQSLFNKQLAPQFIDWAYVKRRRIAATGDDGVNRWGETLNILAKLSPKEARSFSLTENKIIPALKSGDLKISALVERYQGLKTIGAAYNNIMHFAKGLGKLSATEYQNLNAAISRLVEKEVDLVNTSPRQVLAFANGLTEEGRKLFEKAVSWQILREVERRKNILTRGAIDSLYTISNLEEARNLVLSTRGLTPVPVRIE